MTPDIVDIAAEFRRMQDEPGYGQAFIFTSFTESDNPPGVFYWCDALHWARMVEFPGVHVLMTDTTVHPLLWKNSKSFIKLIGDLSDLESFELDVYEMVRAAPYAVVAP